MTEEAGDRTRKLGAGQDSVPRQGFCRREKRQGGNEDNWSRALVSIIGLLGQLYSCGLVSSGSSESAVAFQVMCIVTYMSTFLLKSKTPLPTDACVVCA